MEMATMFIQPPHIIASV